MTADVATAADATARLETHPVGRESRTAEQGTGTAMHESGPARQEAGTDAPEAALHIQDLRSRIDEIDNALIDLWQERAALSRQVGRTRIASGGTRLVLSREREILERFRAALGEDGTQLALLLLRAGRGPL